MEEDKVSIIIPVFNAENTIKLCLESIINQTYKNLQIICIDDGSTDKSCEIIKVLMNKDSRIELIQKSNEGVSSARNVGIKSSNGKYVQFVDSDDQIKHDMVQILVENIESENAELVICGYRMNGKKNICSLNKKKYIGNIQFNKDFYEIYKSTYLNPPWNKLFLREKIKSLYDEKMSIGEDLLFNLKYIEQIKNILIIPNMLYIYTPGSENSLTIKYNEDSFESLIKIIVQIKQQIPPENYNQLKSKLANCYILDYIRYIKALVIKSKKSTCEVKSQIRILRENSIIKNQIFKECTVKKIDRFVLEHFNENQIIIYFYICNIKNKLLKRLSSIKKQLIKK